MRKTGLIRGLRLDASLIAMVKTHAEKLAAARGEEETNLVEATRDLLARGAGTLTSPSYNAELSGYREGYYRGIGEVRKKLASK